MEQLNVNRSQTPSTFVMARHSEESGIGYFVTGTDTGIGKTAITAALTRAVQERGYSVGVMKPVETGADPANVERSDTFRLWNGLASPQTLASVCQYRFPDPLGPLAASRRENQPIDLTVIRAAYENLARGCDYVFVEGIGGVMVPLTRHTDVCDLIAALELPCIVVGRTSLGGVNHLRLTLEVLTNRHIPVVAVALNNPSATVESDVELLQQNSTVTSIIEMTSSPVFAPVCYEEIMNRNWGEGVNRLQHQTAIISLTDLLTQKPR